MIPVSQTAGCSIYCGDDITQADANSQLADDTLAEKTASRFGRAAHLFRDARNARYREWLPRACLVTGTEHESGESLTIGFSGTLRVVDFCSETIFGGSDYERATKNVSSARHADIIISDHPFAFPLMRRRCQLRTPPWVRQQLLLAESWSGTLDNLPSKQRQEIRRILRRHRYLISLSRGRSAIRDYYRHLHAPYLTRRYDEAVILPSESAFLSQNEHMTRIDLLHGNDIVAASLIELRGSTLGIRASSMRADISDLPGRADALDYFSLLLAQLRGCTVLDFGLSRAHLDNGSFRYKSKWGAIPSLIGGFKADICISPVTRSAATLAFLRRNRFLVRTRNGLQAGAASQ